MRKLLLIIAVGILSVGSTYSQWHYTITSQSFNGNCNNIGATLQESIYEQEVPKWAAKTYNSQEECETARQRWGMVNYSSGGCFARVTSSPCQGNTNGGGNGTGTGTGTSIGGGSFKTSMYSSTAIGEPYFAPNEAYAVSSMGEDLEIKLAALNKSFNDAVGGRGIKTGDRPFDEQYKNQVAELSRNRKKEELGDYTLYPRIDKVYLDQENNFSDGTSDIIVPIDPERIKNQERDQMIEKSQKVMQHRLDSIDNKIDSIRLARGEKINNKANEEENLGILLDAFVDVASATYSIMSDAVMLSNDGIKTFELFFDVKVPCSDRLAELEDVLVNSKEVFTESLIGNISEATSTLADQVVVKFIEPTSEVIGGMVTTGSNTYTTIMNSLSAGNLVRSIATDAIKTVSKEINYLSNGGDPNKAYSELGKKYFSWGRDIAKEIRERNSIREIKIMNGNEKK